MISYRKSKASESLQIAEIHLNSFKGFFLTTLGFSFLKAYYKTCAKSEDAISICAIDNETGKLLGFCVGCYHSKGFNKKLILSNLRIYSYQVFILLFNKPLALIRLFKNLAKVIEGLNDDGNYAELLSIGVLPDKNGLGIGKKLLSEFEIEVKRKGVNKITLTTDADANENVLQFYKKSGYKVFYDFTTYPNRKIFKLIKNIVMIPFSPPRIDDKIVNEVTEALKSGWITTGPKTKLFEKRIADYCNVSNVLAVNSWTTGAELLLYWFGIKEGDEVIVPVYTYCASANIVVHRGAKVIMVDITSDFGIDLSKIEKHITDKTKAIIPVDVGGLPINFDELKRIINKKEVRERFVPNSQRQKDLGRILVLSDAAHSFGAKYKGNTVGSEVDFTVFSFHAVKNLTTAEGGAICINLPKPFKKDDVYKELNILSLHGQNKDALAKTQKGSWEYDVSEAGFKCNMTDVLASIGLVELARYKTESLPKRKAIFNKYSSLLAKYDWASIPHYIDQDRESSYHLYLLKIKNISLEQRNSIIQEIFKNNVSVNVHFKPLPLLSFYRGLGYEIKHFPNAEKIWESEISLPVYYDLTMANVEEVVRVLVNAVEKYK